MSVLFTDVMTVYNYRREDETNMESWHRTVVHGVQWSHNRNVFSVQGNVQTVNKVESITIDFMRKYGNKLYLSPHEYKKLPAEQVDNYWTLVGGTDILVLGVAKNEITNSSDVKKLKEGFPYVSTVIAVSDNRNRPRLKNMKVTAKL